MTADDDDFATHGGARLDGLGVALTTPPGMSQGGFRDLGITPLAMQLGLTPDQTNGHWCSRCEGIWFGYTLEAQCPVCGNRKG